jgi:PadR family transcriptional regulator, regulatory protein PadR
MQDQSTSSRKRLLTAYTVWHIVDDRQYMTYSVAALDPALFDNLRLELRRGCLTVAVLAALRSEQYGYTLRKLLEEQGLAVDEGTLYPLLRRLESQGLLVSEWREETKRNKRFYRLSEGGAQMLTQLLSEWRSIDASLRKIMPEAYHGPARTISTSR